MSVANVIPLFPDRTTEKPQSTVAAHNPCPDLSCYSLNSAQKAKGLENIAKVREQLKEYQLKPLRNLARELKKQARESDDLGEQERLKRDIKKLTERATAITERWS